jgi:hypothetical protein
MAVEPLQDIVILSGDLAAKGLCLSGRLIRWKEVQESFGRKKRRLRLTMQNFLIGSESHSLVRSI